MSSDNWGEESQVVAPEDVEVEALEVEALEVDAAQVGAGEVAAFEIETAVEEDSAGRMGVDEVESEEESLEDDIMVLEEGVSPDLPDAVLPVWEPTGNPAVDAALEDLHALADTDVTDHAAVYERVQSSLRATLDGLVAEDEPAS